MIVIDYRQLLDKIDNPPYTLYSAGDRAAWLDECIKTAHAFEVEPVKHGKWIIGYAEVRKIYHAHCSECGKEPTRNIGGDYYIDKLSDYCPNCGSYNKGV